MKLLFRQRVFSWLDSYDIYDEAGNTVYVVKGQLSWGHKLAVYSANGAQLGMVQQRLLTLRPTFELYQGGQYRGRLRREFTLLVPRYSMDYNGWRAEGSIFEWDYRILDPAGRIVAYVTKELFRFTDTYVLDIGNPQDALDVLMFVLAIDAEKCSRES